ATSTGIAEVEHAVGLAEAADADPVNAPCAFAGALDRGAQRPHGLGGVDHVLAPEQPGNARLADRGRAAAQSAARDRLGTAHAPAAFESARAARGEWGWGGMVHGANLGRMKGLSSMGPAKRHPAGTEAKSAPAAAGTGPPNAIDTGIPTRQVK